MSVHLIAVNPHDPIEREDAMSITTSPAIVSNTRAFTVASLAQDDPKAIHISGYQCDVRNLSNAPTCIILHFPGNDISLVDTPPRYTYLVHDMTTGLVALDTNNDRPASTALQLRGNHSVAISETAAGLVDAIDSLPVHCRPNFDEKLQLLLEWYDRTHPSHCFAVIGLSANAVVSTNTVVVQYTPHSDDVVFVPGLQSYNGSPPELDEQCCRDIRVAFASDYQRLPAKVFSNDPSLDIPAWSPKSISGFYDNRREGSNIDYVVALETLHEGFTGSELAEQLI